MDSVVQGHFFVAVRSVKVPQGKTLTRIKDRTFLAGFCPHFTIIK